MNKFELYNLVFKDGESYTDFYFNHRRDKVKSFERKLGNDTIALVNILDIIISDNVKEYKTGLITGVCTSPNMRNKGIMQSLLNEVLEHLKNENYQLAILSPVNNNYYKKYGFKPLVIGDNKITKYIPNGEYTARKATKIDTKLLLELYLAITRNYEYKQIINENVILDIIDEYRIDDINIEIIYKNHNPIGWFVAECDKIQYSLLPDYNILNYIKKLDGLNYFDYNTNGNTDLFQYKILDDNIKEIPLNNIYIINKY